MFHLTYCQRTQASLAGVTRLNALYDFSRQCHSTQQLELQRRKYAEVSKLKFTHVIKNYLKLGFKSHLEILPQYLRVTAVHADNSTHSIS